MQETIRAGKSASFYLSCGQAKSIRAWYWTPERVNASGIKVVSSEERARIESELGLENIGSFRSTRIQCECGQFYGAFEFLQQGIREHCADAVKAVFALKNSTFFRANPTLILVCPSCRQLLGGGIEYDFDRYGDAATRNPDFANAPSRLGEEPVQASVARMERSGIRDDWGTEYPCFATLHTGYLFGV